MFHLYEIPKVVYFIKAESKIVKAQGRVNGELLVVFNEGRISVCKDGKVLRMYDGAGCTTT